MVRLADVRLDFRAGGSRFTLLDIPELSLSSGGTFGLSGPSGSGKTTLLNLLAGLLRPSSGRIYIDGVSTTELSQGQWDSFRADRIGYVFQSFNLIPALNARDNVAIAMSFAGVIPSRERRDRAEALLSRVGLSDRMRHKPAALSHGEMQRVSIARAIANRPKLLLADEPTASLEPGLAASIMDLLTGVASEVGATLVAASHDARVLGRMQEVIELPEINRAAGGSR
jgi:putative ABC transport system ATP-binding protein